MRLSRFSPLDPRVCLLGVDERVLRFGGEVFEISYLLFEYDLDRRNSLVLKSSNGDLKPYPDSKPAIDVGEVLSDPLFPFRSSEVSLTLLSMS